MNDFSRAIAPYLLLLIVIERKRALNALSESEQNRMTIKEFRSDIATFKVNKNNFTDEATNWENRMNDKYGDLIILLGTEIQSLKEEWPPKDILKMSIGNCYKDIHLPDIC